MEKPFPAYQGDEPYVFVCYAHDDEDVVYPEIRWLHEQGFNLWYDEGISAGRIWREEIGDSIKGASSVLYYISNSSLASDHCNREINFALDQHKNVLPVYLDDVALTTDLEVGLSRIQALHRDQDTSYQQHLLNALGQCVEVAPGKNASYASPTAVETHIEPKPKRDTHAGLPKRSRSTLILVGVLAIVIVAGLVLLPNEEPTVDPATTGLLVAEPVIPVPTANATLETSIAVLPFSNMSDDPNQEFFSDGLSEDILNGLVKLSGIKVISRTSSFQFKGRNQDVRKIGEQLDVTHILEGSVRKVGNRIRVTAQLITTTDGTHLWSDQYDRQLTDVFEVQDEITTAILGVLNLHFTPRGMIRPPTTNIEAYEAVLMGRHHLVRFQLDEAVDAFRRAITLDPTYADAYAALAVTHRFYVWTHRASLKAKLPLIRDYADKAIALDPAHRGALRTKIIERFYVDRDYQGAIDEFYQQVLSNPTTGLGSYATLLKTVGKIELAVSLRQREVELNPLSPMSHSLLAGDLRDAGRLAESGDSFRQAEHLGLKSPAQLTINAMMLGNNTAVLEQLDRGDWPDEKLQKLYSAFFAYSQGDSVETMLTEIDSLPNSGAPFIPTGTMLLKGNIDETIDLFERYMDASEYATMSIARNLPPFPLLFPELYEHPRYHAMLKKHGLDDESIAKIGVPPLPF